MGVNLIRGVVIALGILIAGRRARGHRGRAARRPPRADLGGGGRARLHRGRTARAATATGPRHAELSQEAPGPGGGEPTDRPMETRFQRTDERFVDPTTHTLMVVWLDPETGERRYRAEG